MNLNKERGSFILIDFLISSLVIVAGVYLMFTFYS